jgi:hypothetical protein
MVYRCANENELSNKDASFVPPSDFSEELRPEDPIITAENETVSTFKPVTRLRWAPSFTFR